MTAINTAFQGVLTASNRFDKAAVKTVADVSQGKDILSDLVEQMEARIALQANISVAKTAEAMTGQLLDIKA